MWIAGAFIFIFAAIILYLGRKTRLGEEEQARQFRQRLDDYHDDEDLHQ